VRSGFVYLRHKIRLGGVGGWGKGVGDGLVARGFGPCKTLASAVDGGRARYVQDWSRILGHDDAAMTKLPPGW
jgi:hypothetical protein